MLAGLKMNRSESPESLMEFAFHLTCLSSESFSAGAFESVLRACAASVVLAWLVYATVND